MSKVQCSGDGIHKCDRTRRSPLNKLTFPFDWGETFRRLRGTALYWRSATTHDYFGRRLSPGVKGWCKGFLVYTKHSLHSTAIPCTPLLTRINSERGDYREILPYSMSISPKKSRSISDCLLHLVGLSISNGSILSIFCLVSA